MVSPVCSYGDHRDELMKDIVCHAIREKRLLEVSYHGHVRLIAPHVYGVDTTGEELLSCYQVSGGAAGGEHKGWKSLKMRDLSIVRMTPMHFHPRSEFQKNDRALAKIYCQV